MCTKLMVLVLALAVTGSLAASQATGADPGDGAFVFDLDTVLSWTAGASAGETDGHDVYFGTDQGAVTDANVSEPMGVYQGRQSVTSFDPCGLEAYTSYYWRIDEVNESDANIWRGDVWSFLPVNLIGVLQVSGGRMASARAGDYQYSSYISRTIDSSGMTGDLHDTNYNNMWIGSQSPGDESYNNGTVSGENWVAYRFDKPYNLEKMWVWNYNDDSAPTAWQLGLKNVTIQYSATGGNYPSEWETLGGEGVRHQFAPAPGTPGLVTTKLCTPPLIGAPIASLTSSIRQ